MMEVFLGLGSNLGDRFANLSEGVLRLGSAEGIRIIRLSPVYETEPVGDPEQPKFLNAAAGIETILEPRTLLRFCLEIEEGMGRVRGERWGNRVIDIDILFFGGLVLSTKELIVPHPLLHEREFVLRPLADIVPGFVHPVLDESVAQLLSRVPDSGVRKQEGLVLPGTAGADE